MFLEFIGLLQRGACIPEALAVWVSSLHVGGLIDLIFDELSLLFKPLKF